MKKLTDKQYAVLTFVEAFSRENGMPPTVYEIAAHFHLKSSTVFSHLRALQRKNFLTRSSKARSLTLTTGTAAIEKRLMPDSLLRAKCDRNSRIPALFLSRRMLDNAEELFYVQVKDDSLQEFSLVPGDLLLADSKRTPKAGDLVLRMEEKRPVLIRFEKQKRSEFDGVLSAVLHRF